MNPDVLFPLITPGTLTECYDELGNRYQLPVYCLAPPVNLISERSDEDPSDSPEPPVAPKKEFQLKVLLPLCLSDHVRSPDIIYLLKKNLRFSALAVNHPCFHSIFFEIASSNHLAFILLVLAVVFLGI